MQNLLSEMIKSLATQAQAGRQQLAEEGAQPAFPDAPPVAIAPPPPQQIALPPQQFTAPPVQRRTQHQQLPGLSPLSRTIEPEAYQQTDVLVRDFRMEALDQFHDLVSKGHSPESAKAIVDGLWQSSSPERFPGVAPRQSLLPDDALDIAPIAIGAGAGRGAAGAGGGFKSVGDFISQFRLLADTPGIGLEGAKSVLGKYGPMYGVDVSKLGGDEDWSSLFNDAGGQFSGEKFRAEIINTRKQMQTERWDPEGDIPLEGVIVPTSEVMERVIQNAESLMNRRRKDPFKDNPEAANLHQRLQKPFEFMGRKVDVQDPGDEGATRLESFDQMRQMGPQQPGQVWPPQPQQPQQPQQPPQQPNPEDILPNLGNLGIDPATGMPAAGRQSIDAYQQEIGAREQQARQGKMWYSEGDLAKRKNIMGRIEAIRDNVKANGGTIRPAFAIKSIVRELEKLKNLSPDTPQLSPAERHGKDTFTNPETGDVWQYDQTKKLWTREPVNGSNAAWDREAAAEERDIRREEIQNERYRLEMGLLGQQNAEYDSTTKRQQVDDARARDLAAQDATIDQNQIKAVDTAIKGATAGAPNDGVQEPAGLPTGGVHGLQKEFPFPEPAIDPTIDESILPGPPPMDGANFFNVDQLPEEITGTPLGGQAAQIYRQFKTTGRAEDEAIAIAAEDLLKSMQRGEDPDPAALQFLVENGGLMLE